MKKFIIALAATTALSVAAPAVAQNYGNQNNGGQNYGGNIQLRVNQLQTELQAGVRTGEISRSEAMPLREQLRQLSLLERRYAANGISGQERADLQQRINNVRQGIRMAGRDGNGRYDRDDDRYGRGDNRYGQAAVDPRFDRNNDGWDDRDGNRDGRFDVDSRYDSNRDGWDDRDGNRDGRWDVDSRYDSNRDGYDDRDRDRDGRWDDGDDRYDRDEVSNNGDRGIIGQVIDSVTGRGGLRVGQRVSGDLQPLPYAYRSQYRDGNGAYYRTDGRQIYQIDARTQVVARIFVMNR